jgi:hypothetical protein
MLGLGLSALLAGTAPGAQAAASAWTAPTLDQQCDVVQAFVRVAVQRKRFSKHWVLGHIISTDRTLSWSPRWGAAWQVGSGPPASTGLSDAPIIPWTDALTACPRLSAVIGRYGGASGPDAEDAFEKSFDGEFYGEMRVTVSLPILSADRREALLGFTDMLGLGSHGTYRAYLRRDRHGVWRLVGILTTGD